VDATFPQEIALLEEALPLQDYCFNVFIPELVAALALCTEALEAIPEAERTIVNFNEFNACHDAAFSALSNVPTTNGNVFNDFGINCASDIFLQNFDIPPRIAITTCIDDYTDALAAQLQICEEFNVPADNGMIEGYWLRLRRTSLSRTESNSMLALRLLMRSRMIHCLKNAEISSKNNSQRRISRLFVWSTSCQDLSPMLLMFAKLKRPFQTYSSRALS
jgi:hypothetical protein